ncbi:thiamine pyrophosphate-binding protein [Oceanicoccus sp. KOV_DT_Chl]|uniref:thiamine pyrophosphate-binding protein n=1 Tax=Oceanicoccus sp. KOV_DT_Chl TaxID=1904639 RepID=UPI000C7BFD1F|nr:thiamine pyrophosphate-binding protein [Oceanicoccus sp. KOV_DT_Chl]
MADLPSDTPSPDDHSTVQFAVKQLLDGKLSRRGFGKALMALGLSGTAAQSMAKMVADDKSDSEQLPRAGKIVEGTGADVLVETLLAADVEYIFATTATGMSALFDALALRPQIKFVLALQEGQAAAMAHGYELASGKTAALFLPGVAVPNAMNNLYNAWKDRSAIAVFSDAQATDYRGRNQFQQMDDWIEPMKQFTKWAWEIHHIERVSEFTRRALKMANTPPGGPVHIRYPRNVLDNGGQKQTVYPQSLFRVDVNLQPKPELINAAAKLLVNAKRPYINVGHEVTRAHAVDEIIELAEMLGAPVSQGYSVYGDFPFNHPLFAGFYGPGAPRGLFGSDVFLNLGSEMPSWGIIAPPPPAKAHIIHARLEYSDIGNISPTDIAIAGGIKETIIALKSAIKTMISEQALAKISAPRLQALQQKFEKLKRKQKEQAEADWNSSPMSWDRVGYELEQQLEKDAIIVSELNNRTPLEWLNFYSDKKAGKRKRLIGQTTGFALGWGVGAALGVKVAQPDRQVVCLLGDGGFLFGQSETLWMAARHQIPITIVIFDNEAYDGERERIYAFSPLAKDKARRHLWKDISCYLGDPPVDFVKLSESFGVAAERASKPEQMTAALKRAAIANRGGKAYLIDAKIMQQGKGANDNWHPDIDIAALRDKKV